MWNFELTLFIKKINKNNANYEGSAISTLNFWSFFNGPDFELCFIKAVPVNLLPIQQVKSFILIGFPSFSLSLDPFAYPSQPSMPLPPLLSLCLTHYLSSSAIPS